MLVGAKFPKMINQHKEFLNCEHPIIAAAMNRVSDLNLAVACQKAGILPSLSLYSYISENSNIVDLNNFETALKRYQDLTGTNNIIVSASNIDLNLNSIKTILVNNKVTFLEIIYHDLIHIPLENRRSANKALITSLKDFYSSVGIKILPKMTQTMDYTCSHADGVILKGLDGAGRTESNINPEEEIKKIHTLFPNLPVIFSGGVGSKTDVDHYLNLGCIAVGIGTLLAVAEESSISKQTKEKMIESNFSNITRLSIGAEQNALVFGKLEEGDDYNHSNSLINGINDPTKGLIFAGKSIDNIKQIKPVKDIIQELVGLA